MTRKQLDDSRASFYMQEFLPMLFTADQSGWGASSSAYLNEQFRNTDVDSRTLLLTEEISSTGLTKAPQKPKAVETQGAFDLLAPLQVPNDDALIYHSDTTLEEFVETLSNFAETERIRVFVRKHPYDHTGFFDRCRARYTSEFFRFGEGGHIHDDIRSAKAVVVINSGVGFEAMLLGKPVLTFGNAVYESVTYSAKPQDLPEAYRKAVSEPDEQRRQRYNQFISWYVYKYGIKLDEPVLNMANDRFGDTNPVENPLYSRLMFELNSPLNGVDLVRIGKSALSRRIGSQLAYRKQRSRKLLQRSSSLISKRILDKANSRFKKTLMRPLDADIFSGKRVALVGNAASLRSAYDGELIDTHDIVIRMNLGYPLVVRKDVDPRYLPKEWIHGVFVDNKSSEQDQLIVLKPDTPSDVAVEFTHAESLGRRTSIWSCSTSDRSRQKFFKPLFDAETVACHPNFHHLGLGFLIGPAISRLPEAAVYDLRTRLGVEPTSGLIWTEYLATTHMQSLTLFGFDFFKSGHVTRQSRNMLQVTGKWPHNPKVEREYILDLVVNSKDRITIKGW